MKNSQLNRVLKLVRRTGDRMVIMDPETDDVVVLMRLPEYEDLLGVYNEESDKNSRDPFVFNDDATQLWRDEDRSMEDDLGEEESEFVSDGTDFYSPGTIFNKKNDRYPWEDGAIDFDEKKEKYVEKKLNEHKDELNFDDYDWNKEEGIPFNEEDLSDVHEEEEEKFYLEPVE